MASGSATAVPSQPSAAGAGDGASRGRRAGRTRRTGLRFGAAGVLALLAGGALAAARPATASPELRESFAGGGAFVRADWFWDSRDRGQSANGDWFAESGDLVLEGSAARTTSPVFRMWTRRSDLAYATAEMDLRFDGWTGGSEPWHGVNLWLNRTLCTPTPGCEAVDDSGNTGYALDFVNRDGTLTILKKVSGDTRARWPVGVLSYTQGGTYYALAGTRWSPQRGRTYRFAGQVADSGDGTSTLQIVVDGKVLLRVVDDGSVGGAPLTGGRVGLRSDYADVTVDDLVVRTVQPDA